MHAILVFGAILGLLAMAGGIDLAIFVVRVCILLTIAYFAYAIYDMRPTLAERCGKDPSLPRCGDIIPAGWVVTYMPRDPAVPTPKPAAIPAPVTGTFRPPYYPTLPQPPEPQPQPSIVPQGWGVADLSGPWPAPEIQPASARADRLLRLLHAAQGVEVGE